MSSVKQRALILSILVLGWGGLMVSAEGAARQCVSAECACERALEQNTIEALETFLKEYQHDASSKETACAALGVPLEENSDNRSAEYPPSFDQPQGRPRSEIEQVIR